MHKPVLLKEATFPLLENPGRIFVDCTLGGGGHLELILKGKPDAIVFAFDRDLHMLEKARTRFREEISTGRLNLIHANYSELKDRLLEHGVHGVDGILLDAGVSSFQLDSPERGFSFMRSGPLDMRMDPTQKLTAHEIVNEWSQEELEKIFFEFGEERFSRKIAGRIVERRSEKPIDDTLALAGIVADCLPRTFGKGPHPATRVFQAIRIAVNQELEGLQKVLELVPDILNPGGVFAAISFHSLEDRLIKDRLRFLTTACICPLEVITCARCNKPPGVLVQRKPIIPSQTETDENPRARSAKLRVFIKNRTMPEGKASGG